MPIALHQHLKRGFQYDICAAEPFEEDAEVSDNYLTAEERSAKRRRVELIATQYLKGSAPFILSARLKGPFDKSWKNPWAKKKRSAKEKPNTRAGDVQDEQEDVEQHASSRPSPEVSRATQTILDYHTQSTAERSHTTASKVALQPQGNEQLQRQYLSANVEPDVTVQDLDNGQAWLKRPSNSRIRGGSFKDPCPHPSPTPTRHGNMPIDRHGKIQITLPKSSIARASTPSKPRPPIPEAHWRSSASAPMNISSPVKPPGAVKKQGPPTASKFAQKHPGRNDQRSGTRPVVSAGDDLTECQIIALYEQPSSNDIERRTQKLVKEVIPGRQPANSVDNPGATSMGVSSQSKSRRPSRKDIQRSAERCITRPTTANTVTNKPSKKTKSPRGHSLTVPCGPKLVASPAPNSSIGFEYQKVQRPKTGPGKPPKKDPKPVNFQSSPEVIEKDKALLSDTGPSNAVVQRNGRLQDHGDGTAQHQTSKNMPPPRPDIYDIRSTEQELNDTASSRQSLYSTQAAMLLAQLEFQEGSFLSPASETPRTLPVLQENGTPRADIDEPSDVSITPFHAFNAELDKNRPTNNMAADVAISTQDLFSAASPYTFSTVKKKTVRTARSSLRFAIHPSPPRGDDDHANADHAKSPSPSRERIPLRERNSKVTFGTNLTGSDKGSQDPPLLPAEPPASPKLGNLLDDLGLNASFSFTSNFIKDINAIT
ncbi:hypothetical protein BDV96DRAFT_641185 [Lophiotrema nucula]|uniref:Uncharacterized protein n=1 Tax=Lophiotrema nucula TaxID=690887 RepID=A0A6A5ZQI8_9PLEO|nr:hypothetical protein BDV96DRAFT_641185 [Lophiotrema nucula]